MNWFNKTRFAAALLSCVVMILSPVAHGKKAAEVRLDNLKEFLKVADFVDKKKRMTVGEFHRKFRLWYPQPLRSQLDTWSARHRYELMPKVDSHIFKDKDGNDQVRLLFSKDGQTFSMTTAEGSAQILSQKVTVKDYYDTDAMIKRFATKDPYVKKILRTEARKKLKLNKKVDVTLNANEWHSFTPKQRANYLLQMRYLIMASMKVLGDDPGKKGASKKGKSASVELEAVYQALALLLTGSKAGAADADDAQIPKPNDACIVAGYISIYGDNKLSCGGADSGMADWGKKVNDQFKNVFPKATRCGSGQAPCNPLVYGFSDAGEPHCLDSANLKFATRDCGQMSPLDSKDDKANAKRIVESWLRAKGIDDSLEVNEDGDLHPDSYAKIEHELDALQAYLDKAQDYCSSNTELLAKREDQASACEEIEKRRFALNAFTVAPVEENKCADQPGMQWDEAAGKCVCAGGCTEDSNGKCVAPVEEPQEPAPEDPAPQAPPEPVAVKEKTNWTPWIIGGLAVGAIALCIFWFCKGDKDKGKDIYIPKPRPPKPPKPWPPVDPPPPPPPPPGEGGTEIPDDDAGGVR